MRIRDGSSDVCSSYLGHIGNALVRSVIGGPFCLRGRFRCQPSREGRFPFAQFLIFDRHSLIHGNDGQPSGVFWPSLFRHGGADSLQRGVIRQMSKHGPPVYCEDRSEEHTSELQSLMRISYAVFCLKKKKKTDNKQTTTQKKYNK